MPSSTKNNRILNMDAELVFYTFVYLNAAANTAAHVVNVTCNTNKLE